MLGVCAVAVHANAPKAVVDAPHFDFGEQPNNQTIEHTFVLRNEGDATLEITNIRSSCGCTVGNVSSLVVAPGETSDITGLFNLRGRQGTQRSVLTVELNDPARPRLQLSMGGVATQELDVRPNRLFFGQVYGGQQSTRQVEVVGRPETPFDITGVETGSEYFSARVLEAEAPHHYRIDIETAAPQQAGMIQAVVRIHTTHPKFPVLQLPVNAQVAGALTYAPNQISLLAEHQTPVTRYIVVRPGTVQDFEITEVETPQDDMRVQILNMPNQGYRIQLNNVTPTKELAGQSLRIHTNVEGMAIISIPFVIVETVR